MGVLPQRLIARTVPDAVPAAPRQDALRVIVASLARGGAERIVIEWLDAEVRRGRPAELAILHRRRQEYPLPAGITPIRRGNESVEAFVDALGDRWRDAPSPVSAHLVADALLARLWARGLRVVPVLHNTREGWRNDPASWPAKAVPFAVACAEAVREEAQRAGCRVPVISLAHRPAVGPAAWDVGERERIRSAWHIPSDAFVVGVVGAFKAQKDHARAVSVLAELVKERKACLVVLGGVLDASGLAELDRVADRAAASGIADALRLPGFVEPVEPWYAALDALLNVSRHEGLSMATREALAAGLPVVAVDVGGQREIARPGLRLLPPSATPAVIARCLAGLPVRTTLVPDPVPRFPRAWSLTTCWREPRRQKLDTVFVTANLNAGGAQRSLVNLAARIAGRHRFAVAVCGETTHPAFPAHLASTGVACFRPAPTADSFDAAQGILARATAGDARSICFWNADPRVKLLVAKFAPSGLRLVDASPGAYAYHELDNEVDLAQALAFGPPDYYRRLDCLVTKYRARSTPDCRRVEVIVNGVALREPADSLPPAPRFLVSGRIAPSKRLETVIAAFREAVASVPNARLDIVGQAEPRHGEYLSSLVAASADLGVIFHGASPGLEILGRPITAAVVLGTHQGCPNAVLEAMAAGVAVIANDSGGTRELVRRAETGWLLSEACPVAELVEAFLEASADAGRAQRLGHAGRALVSRHHSLEAMAVRYLSVLESNAGDAPALHDNSDGLPRLFPA
jgi:glycosyltransferase involved in cell wall biosynthesis